MNYTLVVFQLQGALIKKNKNIYIYDMVLSTRTPTHEVKLKRFTLVLKCGKKMLEKVDTHMYWAC